MLFYLKFLMLTFFTTLASFFVFILLLLLTTGPLSAFYYYIKDNWCGEGRVINLLLDFLHKIVIYVPLGLILFMMCEYLSIRSIWYAEQNLNDTNFIFHLLTFLTTLFMCVGINTKAKSVEELRKPPHRMIGFIPYLILLLIHFELNLFVKYNPFIWLLM